MKNTIFIINDVFKNSYFLMIETEEGIQTIHANYKLIVDDLEEFLEELNLNVDDFRVVATRGNFDNSLEIITVNK